MTILKAALLASAAGLLGLARPAAAAPGTNSFDFLKLPTSPQQAAMGQSGVAYADGYDAGDLNPAALSLARQRVVNASFSQLYGDVSFGRFAYAHPTEKLGNLGASLTYLDYGTIAAYDQTGAAVGKVSASDRLLRLNWAPRREGLVGGVSVKTIQEKLDNVTATAFALDAGVLYRPWPDDAASSASAFERQLAHLTFGAALRNAGPAAKFESRKESLPFVASVGAAHQSFADALTFAVDLEHTQGRALVAHLGMEAWLRDVLALRLGLRSDQDIGPGLSAGVGFRLNNMRIDYAFVPFGDLGQAHHVSLSLRFGSNLANSYFENGVHEMREGRYAEAVLQFDKALALDPQNPRIIKMALEAGKALRENSGAAESARPPRP